MDALNTEEEDVLTADVSDQALEIAGMASGQVNFQVNFTWGVCTLDQAGCPA